MTLLTAPTTLAAFSRLAGAFHDQGDDVSSLGGAGGAMAPGPGDAPRIMVFGSQPPVVQALVADLNNMLALSSDWDTYGGRSSSITAARAAVSWLLDAWQDGLPAPAVVPGSDGSIQLEWHTRGIDLEVRFEASGAGEFSFEDLNTGEESFGPAHLACDHVQTLASRPAR